MNKTKKLLLLCSQKPQSGEELVTQLDMHPKTIASRTSILVNAGILESIRVGEDRRNVEYITPKWVANKILKDGIN